MAAIMSLPNEMIIIILENLTISIKDIVNFSSTCRKFREIGRDKTLWEQKFYQRWPTMKKIYDSKKLGNEDRDQIDFKEQFKESVKFTKEMWEVVSQMYSDKSKTDKTLLILYFLSSNVNSLNSYCLAIDECNRVYLQSPRTPGLDLTRRVHCPWFHKLLIYYGIWIQYLTFEMTPKNQQLLEQLVTIVVQWCAPNVHISYLYVKALLDKTAQKVLQTLKKECPTHPISQIDNDEDFNKGKDNNIDYSRWDYEEILQILNITKKIIFSDRYFHKLNALWSINSDLNAFEDIFKIKRDSQYIFLLTIYHSVMRRFGISSLLHKHCKLQIFFKSKDNTRNEKYFCYRSNNDDILYLDNKIRTENHSVDQRDYLQVIKRLIKFLKIELNKVSSQDIDVLNKLMSGNDLSILELQSMKVLINFIPRKVREERLVNIKFVIGTIVTHYCNNETHFGVIVGWNLNYNPSTIDIKFKISSSHSNLFRKCGNFNCTDSLCHTESPYYAILCNNNKFCYIGQEQILKCRSPTWIDHTEIGRYLCRFEGNYYVPNDLVGKDYPSDIAIINGMRHN